MKLASLSLALAVVAVCALGCGSQSGVAGDAGTDGPASETTSGGRLSFDVTAALSGAAGAGPVSNLPATSTFTLVLDAAAGQAIVGARGRAAMVTATTTDGRTFQLAPFSVGTATGVACQSVSSIDFKTFDVLVTGGGLQGQATGTAQISCGDCAFSVPFSASVAGLPDATAPFLIVSGTGTSGPFTPVSFVSNEPLPATAKASIETPDGAHIDLQPLAPDGEPALVYGFTTPNVVLPPSDGFIVPLDGLVDFAGHSGAAGTPLRLAGFPAPLLMPADGFESVTTAQVGGAAVIGAGAPLPPISGAKSVYFGGPGAPAIPGATFGSALRVRLAVQPGSAKLHFSYRLVSSFSSGGASPAVYVGSVGRAIAPAQRLDSSQNGTSQVTWSDGKQVTVTAVAAQDIPLPADITDEVVVSIEAFSFGCGGPAPPPDGVEIDDLTLE